MTDAQIPKGNQGMSAVSLPNISWFEFILDKNLLKEHLDQENPDPTPCQLIIQFLQQAEVEMAALIQTANEKKAQGPPGAIPIPVNKVEEGTLKTYLNFLFLRKSNKLIKKNFW
ncbi:integrator complex subunit 8 [Elysia marginata]|uniref:Integrator complex subunit 8 n=1 Tax=Elysia marginata TaxID=1093978 RepID=A0AAV4F515_9GAST|nr:integrator complex subunit 8 [Elysia marginata]